MASLVADYRSDSESSFDSDSSEIKEKEGGLTVLPKPALGLPKPNFKIDSSVGQSVFVNPFAEADNAKIAILEKHVKMISTDVKMVNGRKICWNYRKNKCRFGHNCKYAHDSDLQINPTQTNLETSNQDIKINVLGKNLDNNSKINSESKKRPAHSNTSEAKEKLKKLSTLEKLKSKKCV